MECPACQTDNPPGQKFCGTCGCKIELSCARCGADNPPRYKFCGQCGTGLTDTGAITLARSGLITRVDQKALDLLGLQHSDMHGKPFSLFVEQADLVIFFSHWNEFLSHCEMQCFEVALKHPKNKSIYVALELRAAENSDQIMIVFNKVSENRLLADQMQYKQELLGLIFLLSESIKTTSKKHLDQTIEDGLKKICLIAKADRGFIYRINRRRKRIEPACQWRQPSSSHTNDEPETKSVPFRMITQTVTRLRKEQAFVVDNMGKLAPSLRNELLAWLQTDLGAVLCHIIYSGRRPIGIIGLANRKACDGWDSDCVALVRFFGQMVSYRLPFADFRNDSAKHYQAPVDHTNSKVRSRAEQADSNVIHISDVIDITDELPGAGADIQQMPASSTACTETNGRQAISDTNRPMLLNKLPAGKAGDQQRVFPRDDGLVLLTCPHCGLQESVSIDQFSKLGNAISVNCPCREQFTAVLEKRRAMRKSVKLDGYFSLEGDSMTIGDKGSIWGPMVVKDLSKAGLRFSSRRADLVHPGDLLMVRFNLDNANRSLIHKPVRVVSTNDDEVGCRFEGADSYDITLGFYFL